MLNAVLHDVVVTMGVYADVGLMLKAPVHYGAENAVNLRQASNPMHNVVRTGVFQPGPAFNIIIGRFRRRDIGKIANNPLTLRHHKAVAGGNIGLNNLTGRVAVHPLADVAACAHNAFGRFQNGHYGRKVRGMRTADGHHCISLSRTSMPGRSAGRPERSVWEKW